MAWGRLKFSSCVVEVFLPESGGVNHGGMAQLQLRSPHSALPLLWQPGQSSPALFKQLPCFIWEVAALQSWEESSSSG